jgi:alpha-glucosidase (family GH31 glycosyl hydrolase)
LYGLFAEARRTGAPIMRPLFWHYQKDSTAVAIGDQFLLGRDLLVAPIVKQGARARAVYLPQGDWFDFWSGEKFAGGQHIVAHADLETLPLYVRAGGIVPMCAVQQFVGENETGIVNLHLWPGGRGELNWYEDDGGSMTYETGDIHERVIRFDGDQLVIGKSSGAFVSKVKTWRVILREAQGARKVLVNGKRVKATFDAETRVLAFEVLNVSGTLRAIIS